MKSILPDDPTARPKPRATRARTRGPRARPTPGEARARRQPFRQAPELKAKATTKLGTIPLLQGFAKKPFRKTVFTTGRSPTRLRTPARCWLALAGCVGQRGATTARLRGRCSPRCRREVRGSDSEAGGEVARPPHDGGQSARAVKAFRRAGALRGRPRGWVSFRGSPRT
jgi:hypothetical protein